MVLHKECKVHWSEYLVFVTKTYNHYPMKKSLIILLLLLYSAGLYAQRVTYYTPSMYRNLEKYWWFRYRLVNDFMKIGTECGESIPMEHWAFESPNNKVFWGDATQHLGNYMNVLAGEWRILHDCGLNTRRTEEELYDALSAFDRLDKKAEPVFRNIDAVYPYCGSIDIAGVEHADDLNGFFIRNDVPSVQSKDDRHPYGLDNFMVQNRDHFHRPGFYYNSKEVKMEEDYGSMADIYNHPPKPPSTPWPYARGTGEVSQDQISMLYGGMGMTGFLLGSNVMFNGRDLRESAREQIYRILEWPAFNDCHTVMPWDICNPVTNRCVGDPTNNCNSGGGQILINSVGAVAGLSHMGLVARASNYPHSYGQMVNTTSNPTWDSAYQFLQNLNAYQFSSGNANELFYSNMYSAFADNWKEGVRIFGGWGPTINFVNTTKKKIALHSTSVNWAWPQLPLMWQIVNGQGPGSTVWFNMQEKEYEHVETYPTLLSDAPFCGCHSYKEGAMPFFRPVTGSNDYGQDEDFKDQYAWQWSNANRLQDFGKRGKETSNSDFNNLDYMTVFNLYAIIDGRKAIDKMMNPYYKEDYSTNYGSYSTGYGSKSQPLKLNFLEYLSMKNQIYSQGNLKVRCAKTIELKPGFEAHSGATFEATVRDYRCQEEGYVYALAKDQPTGMVVGYRGAGEGNPNADGDTDEDGYRPLDFPPDGVDFNININQEQYDSEQPTEDSISVEDEMAYQEELIKIIYDSKDSTVINFIQPYIDKSNEYNPSARGVAGINTTTTPQSVSILLYPNPTKGTCTLLCAAPVTGEVKVFNVLGESVYTRLLSNEQKIVIDLGADVAPGNYTVQIQTERGRTIKKLTIVR